MKKKKDKSISLKFLIFLAVSITVIIIYCTYPDTLEKIKNNITYEELLERSQSKRIHTKITYERPIRNKKIKAVRQKENNTENTASKITKTTNEYQNENNFNKLLDELKKYPSNSAASAQTITERILKYLGYNGYEVKVKSENMSADGTKPKGTTVAAYFDIREGILYLNKDLISKLNVKEITAIIIHELDHFDKIAKLCKSMGSENFFNFLKENNIEEVNKEFWKKASEKANLTNFNSALYKNALERFINGNKLEIISIYSDINSISESLRNPLEISAYQLSDYVLNYYNLRHEESLTQKLANQFNKADWAIYNLTSKDNELLKERIAIFDYLLMQAIIENNPKYTDLINKCTSSNGDLTPFWEKFKKDNNDFFDKNLQTKSETYNYIIRLLSRVETLANNGTTANNKADAIKLYIYKLTANTKYKNTLTYLKNSVEDYLIITSKNKISSSKDELRMYLILICLENNINSYERKDISLYYLKIPPLLEKLNNSNKKSQRFNFIYENQEFTAELNKQKEENSNITEQKLLTEMLEKTASEIK